MPNTTTTIQAIIDDCTALLATVSALEAEREKSDDLRDALVYEAGIAATTLFSSGTSQSEVIAVGSAAQRLRDAALAYQAGTATLPALAAYVAAVNKLRSSISNWQA